VSKYVLLYLGGTAPASEDEGAAVAAAWGDWFDRTGDALVDPGNQFGTVTRYGTDTAPSEVNGYSIVAADDTDAVDRVLDGHPHLAAGGTIEVHETVAM
jgi:hypothetical protein